MGIFDKIKDAIFGHQAHAAPMPETAAAEPAARRTSTSAPLDPSSAQAASPSAASAPVGNASTGTAPTASPTAAPVAPAAPATPAPPTPAPASASASAGAPAASGSVDIEPILDAAVKKNGQHLDWRKSIVDLMKALNLDSSLEARKELAQELHYTGDANDSATMNVWLHKALMKKLAENGGKVPADLAD